MEEFIQKVKKTNTIEGAKDLLKEYIEFDDDIKSALEFAIKAHKNQFRKSGEDYVVHPILVSAITARFSNDKDMVIAALLHDVVEDTEYSLDDIKNLYGEKIAHLVDGLTKIVAIREEKLISSKSEEKLLTSALSFRKMLIASIKDIRVLVVKLCDRLHNMLTLDSLKEAKQKRISEETLLVYTPIAHRLGISTIKNYLEDLAFFYLYPKEYKEIDSYINSNKTKLQVVFNNFISDVKKILINSGLEEDSFQIHSRIKHYYSIYMKMQRKGINIDEVLDLLAIRILLKDEIECYKVLGLLHTTYKPLIARFKDYIAIPKENGYQTIHTTLFFNSKIYEVQIRTFSMHKVAEYGVAAHWKYKEGANKVKLDWLESLEFDSNPKDFINDTKDNIFSEDIVVYSPKGDIYTLPFGATAYDFAYMIHTDIGNRALEAYINKVKKPLLTQLKNGDIVSIEVANFEIPRCSWIDMLKTSKAKKAIKNLCSSRLKLINELSGKNIINTIFSRYTKDILSEFKDYKNIHKVAVNLDYLKNLKKIIERFILRKKGIIARLKVQNIKLKEYKFDNILIYSNFYINSVSFDHCCHPKFGDSIVCFKDGLKAEIHHKMCDKAYAYINTKHNMLFCKWVENELFEYNMVISLPNTKGELAKILSYLAKYDINITSIEYGKDKLSHIQYCNISFETGINNKEKLKELIAKKVKIISFVAKKDAYS